MDSLVKKLFVKIWAEFSEINRREQNTALETAITSPKLDQDPERVVVCGELCLIETVAFFREGHNQAKAIQDERNWQKTTSTSLFSHVQYLAGASHWPS